MTERLRICWLPDLTPYEFIQKWQGSTLNERQSYQAHFADLCALVGVEPPSPATADNYCFERGVAKTGSRHGWADVWMRGCFAFEYKAPDRNLDAALKQLMTYALALENPPLLVVCDTQILQIHTHFTNAPSEVHTILLQDIGLPANLDKLRWLFTDPDKFHPQRTIAQITEQAAGRFADLAQSLNSRNYPPQQVAHFLNQCLFCLFAEDAGLLPLKMFERLLDKSQHESAKLSTRLTALFASMQTGGDFGADDIAWFNGGLFETVEVLLLVDSEIASLHAAAKLDWSDIEPSIFGTLFERGLDPKKRAQLGAHYTDQQSIMRIIKPVIVEPLAAEWQVAKVIIAGNMSLFEKGGKGSKNALPLAQGAFIAYLERLKHFKVLDPACGSGNFLYLALRALKDLEHKANLEAEMLGLQRQISIEVSPANVLGIEINPYATELARVTVWIGEIQWMLKNGYPIRKNPILQSLDHIENRDALLVPPFAKGGLGGISESRWPTVDVIVGNPPFLGGSKLRGELGDDYTEALRLCFEGRVPGGADLVTYWFEKARAQIEAGQCQRAGLVATQSIRKGSNQQVLARIIIDTPPKSPDTSDHHEFNHLRHPGTDRHAEESGHSAGTSGGGGASDRQSSGSARDGRDFREPSGTDQSRFIAHQMDDGRGDCRNGDSSPLTSHQHLIKIFNAWSDEPWINDGAAVRVSLVCFGTSVGIQSVMLDGNTVDAIHADLTSGCGLNLTLAKPLKANAGVAFEGTKKYGNFDITGELARQWLKQPNPNGMPNSDVLKPWANGMDITSRPSDTWIIDFGASRTEQESALYEIPFDHALREVKAQRKDVKWWLHERPRPALRTALAPLKRYIVTPRVAKHRMFVWLDVNVLPDSRLFAIAREDDTTFGILSSRIHEVWSLGLVSMHGDGGTPTYNAKSCFETFPFPAPASETADIAAAAQALNTLRNNWLNPPEWVEWVRTAEEEKAGYPLRPVAKDVGLKSDLQKRTLTNLYNARPAWLDNAHKTLDAAVARAYGWTDYTHQMPDEEILRRLLALNLERGG